MADERKSRMLSVVSGSGEGDGRRVGRLATVQANVPAVHQQLGLPAVSAHQATIVSLGMDAVDFESFRELIVAYGIRRIVDIRILASFRGRGFEPSPVFEFLRGMNVSYERITELGNRFVGESVNEHVVFNKFLAHLHTCQDSLRRLREQVEHGPLLLLGRASEHCGSERDAVVKALGVLAGEFDLIALQPRYSEKRCLLDACHGNRESDAHASMPSVDPVVEQPGTVIKRKPRRNKRAKQAKLNFIG